MKITQRQLDELIRLITKSVLKEWSSLSGDDDDESSDSGSADDGVKPQDAMTASEKAKQERLQKLTQKNNLDYAKKELETAKKEKSFQQQKVSQTAKYDIPRLTKKVQAISAGKQIPS